MGVLGPGVQEVQGGVQEWKAVQLAVQAVQLAVQDGIQHFRSCRACTAGSAAALSWRCSDFAPALPGSGECKAVQLSAGCTPARRLHFLHGWTMPAHGRWADWVCGCATATWLCRWRHIESLHSGAEPAQPCTDDGFCTANGCAGWLWTAVGRLVPGVEALEESLREKPSLQLQRW
jgi:hypothetical protein